MKRRMQLLFSILNCNPPQTIAIGHTILGKKKANISFEVLEGKVHGVNVHLKLQMIQLQEMQKGPT
jgi:hypothetical protein